MATAEICDAPTDTRTTRKTVAAANTNCAIKCNHKKDCSSGRCKCIKNAVDLRMDRRQTLWLLQSESVNR